MKFALMSDLHGYVGFAEELPEQKDTILLLPGDLDESRLARYREMLTVLTNKFSSVYLVPGNHEYYGSNIQKTHQRLQVLDDEIENFHFLNNSYKIVDDVLIIGGTLWTDFDSGNPLTKFDARLKMNDYKQIRFGPESVPWQRKLTPEDTEFFHHITKNYLRETVDNQRGLCDNLKTVVLTHHAPSFQSVPEKFANDSLNGCYCSNMDYVVGDINANVWVHGHIHSNSDYMLGDTRVICNPRGYGQHSSENPQFSSTFTFEV